MLASCPASMLNQISLKLGIPFDSFLSHPALGDSGAGVVPITGEDPAARADALDRVTAFLSRHILN